jgi:hypothetical protein
MQRAFPIAGLALSLCAGLGWADDGPYYLHVAPWARLSNGPDYTGYYVGGGATWRGQPRFPNEGTWGWDYAGRCFTRHVWLEWWHGRRYQSGSGNYQSDGPECHLGEKVMEKMTERGH